MERVVLCMIDEQTPPAVCELGADLAQRLGLPLELLHVARDPSASRFGPGPERERERHRAVGEGEELLGRFGGLTPPGTECRVELGDALGVTLSRATDAALVVVGSRGRGALTATLFGSFSRQVAREAPCPVVVVPPGAVGAEVR